MVLMQLPTLSSRPGMVDGQKGAYAVAQMIEVLNTLSSGKLSSAVLCVWDHADQLRWRIYKLTSLTHAADGLASAQLGGAAAQT